jgi:phosphatidylserine/phosphatidylglycerophosphate/cardiolipin synthase-like enzyme
MIEIIPGREVVKLLTDVASRPQLFSELTLCSPFIDEDASDRLRTVVEKAVSAGCAVTIVTRPISAVRISHVCERVRRTVRVVYRNDLHAKAYVAQARSGRGPSEAIVTSANLTNAGFGGNLEIGVRIRPSSLKGRRLFEQVRRNVRDLSNPLSRGDHEKIDG